MGFTPCCCALFDQCHPGITASSGYLGVSLLFLLKPGITRDNLGYPVFCVCVSGIYRDIPILVEISKVQVFWVFSNFEGITQDDPVADGARSVLAPPRLRLRPPHLPPYLQQH